MDDSQEYPARRWNPAEEAKAAERRWRIKERYRDAEKTLAQAASPESLKGNPYRGKPINLDANPYEKGWGMAFRMLKSAGFTLPWIQERSDILEEKKEIAGAIDQHLTWLGEKVEELQRARPVGDGAQAVLNSHERFVRHIRERVEALRKKIQNFNLGVPLIDQQLVNVRPEQYEEEIRSRAREIVRRIELLG